MISSNEFTLWMFVLWGHIVWRWVVALLEDSLRVVGPHHFAEQCAIVVMA